MTQENYRPILLVEDDPADANLLCRAFEKAKVLNRVIHLSSGDEALAYMAGVKEYADRSVYPLPALILLDLKLPGLTGMQLLQWKRAHENVRRIPLVVLTGDSDPQTVAAAYDLGANSYLVKRAKSSEILTLVKAIDQYWVRLNEAPLLVTGADAGT